MKKIYFLVLALCLFTGVNAQIINIPDAAFKSGLLIEDVNYSGAYNSLGQQIVIDANNNNEIEVSEALNVYQYTVGSNHVTNLTGIEYFTNLKYLDCQINDLTSLNLTTLTNLQFLNCGDNNLSSLNITGLTNLKELYYNSNNLPNLNLSSFTNLERLSCSNNFVSNLNLSGLNNLKHLHCDNNQLTNLNLTGLTNLEILHCYYNNLTSLNFTGLNLNNLYQLYCGNNPLISLDLNSLPSLMALNAQNCNQLQSLFVKHGIWLQLLTMTGCTNLVYVCCDEDQIANIQVKLNNSDLYNCVVNSYCSFVPGGTFYTIKGNQKFNWNGNVCDASDIPLPNLKFSISNGSITGAVISDSFGNYSIPVQSGNYTITPIFENPLYFMSSPASATVSFPTQSSPFTQNFCISENNSHPDLEVVILPVTSSRPGFDSKFKIVYKNKGTFTQSGSVNFAFNDSVLDFVSSNVTPTSQVTNNLSWNFTNLRPFETREIEFLLNVNSPMETPPVNAGDVLSFTVTISSVATDDTPNDNIFVLNQRVVNSYDPNDKTCLEGVAITPSKVGDYVHYMIRFENTGTFPAENIVITDLIDTNKFVVNSIVPIKGSHNFFTRINGNKVEFIFENINLPFDDANNDGYISFKIRTKPTLVLGNTFSNSASIYFDYNFPIVTNTATTTIQALSRQDFEFSSYFKLYPNPVSTTLNIETKETIEITSINIYNALGQLVLVVPNAQNVKTVDVSILSSGNYFIKINSDKGTSNTKFIKQ